MPCALSSSMRNGNNKTKRILIVEDDTTLVHSIAFTLKRHGYAVTVMSRARQAFKAITTQNGTQATDLMITDIQLPDMTGRELIDELVKRDALPPTIVMTAYASSELFDELRHKGVRECLAKPFDIKELIKLVSELLDENSGNQDH
jgi:two-component system response regulator FixJ